MSDYTYTVTVTPEGESLVNGIKTVPPQEAGAPPPTSDEVLDWVLREIAVVHRQTGGTLTLTLEDTRQGGYGRARTTLKPGQTATLASVRARTDKDLTDWTPPSQASVSTESSPASEQATEDAQPPAASPSESVADEQPSPSTKDTFTHPAPGPAQPEDPEAQEQPTSAPTSHQQPGEWAPSARRHRDPLDDDATLPAQQPAPVAPQSHQQQPPAQVEPSAPPRADQQQGQTEQPVADTGQQGGQRSDEKPGAISSLLSGTRNFFASPEQRARRAADAGTGKKGSASAGTKTAVALAPEQRAEQYGWTPRTRTADRFPNVQEEDERANQGASKRDSKRPATATRVKRWRAVAVVAVIIAVVLAVALVKKVNQGKPSFTAICVDQRTTVRVAQDELCKSEAAHYRWWYVAHGDKVPPVTGAVDQHSGGFDKPTSGARITYGFTAKGGTAQ